MSPKAPDVWAQRVIAAFNVHDTRKLAGFAAAVREIIEAEVRTLAAGEQQPVALVPVHPRLGPLWANTVSSAAPDNVPASYPLMNLYAAPLREQGEENTHLREAAMRLLNEVQINSQLSKPDQFILDIEMVARAALAGAGPNEGSAHPVDAASTTLPLGSGE